MNVYSSLFCSIMRLRYCCTYPHSVISVIRLLINPLLVLLVLLVSIRIVLLRVEHPWRVVGELIEGSGRAKWAELRIGHHVRGDRWLNLMREGRLNKKYE